MSTELLLCVFAEIQLLTVPDVRVLGVPRRVIAKVEWHPGQRIPRVGFIVTNL